MTLFEETFKIKVFNLLKIVFFKYKRNNLFTQTVYLITVDKQIVIFPTVYPIILNFSKTQRHPQIAMKK